MNYWETVAGQELLNLIRDEQNTLIQKQDVAVSFHKV